MNNTIRMFSNEKDYRMVLVDTKNIANEELKDFTGTDEIRNILTKVITVFALFSGLNEHDKKISLKLNLSNNYYISSIISDKKLHLGYSEELNNFEGAAEELFREKSIMSITSGDWETGLYTGTVEVITNKVEVIFSHFTAQSEQLPSSFKFAEDNYYRGLLVQALPFADENKMGDIIHELHYYNKELENKDWKDVPELYKHLATVISESNLR